MVVVVENGFGRTIGIDIKAQQTATMPPQKNSGNKGAKRNSSVDAKNNKFIAAFMSDVKEGGTEGVYVSRIMNRFGNGRMGVVFMDEDNRPRIVQASIRGSFRGKGKRDAYMDIGSIVIIADSGISGPSQFEIMSVLSDSDVEHLRRETDIDARIFDINNVDSAVLLSDGTMLPPDIEFAEEEVDIEKI